MCESKYQSPVWQLPKEDFKELVERSGSYIEVLKSLGLKRGSEPTLKERIDFEGLSVEHFSVGKNAAHPGSRPLSEILVKDSPHKSTNDLKHRLWKHGILKRECYVCGIKEEWNGKFLALQLDHVNGDRQDNRIENLRIVCPNCHTQTHSYAGKSDKAKNRSYVVLCKSCKVVDISELPFSSPLCLDCSSDDSKRVKYTKSRGKYRTKCTICHKERILKQPPASNRCKSCAKKYNSKKNKRVSKEELNTYLAQYGQTRTAKFYNVSRRTIRRWKKKL